MEAELNSSLPCFSSSPNESLYKIRFRCSFLSVNLTSCTPVQSQDEVDTITDICQALSIVRDVGFWVSLVVGLLGNGLAIFTVTSLPKSTSTFYVGLLAVSDLAALCIRGTIDVLSEHSIITHGSFYSDIIPLVFDYCASYSNWLLAYGVAVSLLDYTDPQVFGVRNMLYAVMPLALNSVIILLISCQLRRVQRARKKIMQTHSRSRAVPAAGSSRPTNSTSGTSPQHQPNTVQNIAHLENSITVMMLVAAVCFFLLTMPNCVLLYCYEFIVHMLLDAPVFRAKWLLISRVTELLTFLNLSVNFVLYFLSAKKFRSHLYRVLTPKSWSVRSGNVGGNVNTTSQNHSVLVFRAVQLPRPSENIPLRRQLGSGAGNTDISPGETTRRSDLSDSVLLCYGRSAGACSNGHAVNNVGVELVRDGVNGKNCCCEEEEAVLAPVQDSVMGSQGGEAGCRSDGDRTARESRTSTRSSGESVSEGRAGESPCGEPGVSWGKSRETLVVTLSLVAQLEGRTGTAV